ncbi:ASCH domain-containing protein [Brunnivagina elsteri]|uniref:ASCH domain-containing protein n=1 Tax=Brunnivagina elsteri TaxID=1247191 RepID=UPI001B8010B6|nr:ASCH domain-containing protein [Calothrix elsteri]
MGYSSPLELTRETPPPADDGKHSEIPSVSKRRKQHSSESCTSIPLVAKKVKESGGKYSASANSEFKAISLWQPWASLIPLGLKKFETRSWKTSYRGKLLICSTANNPKHYQEYLKIKDKLQLPAWDEVNFPHGRAIALCDLVDCTEMTPEFIEQQSQTEINSGDWQVGRYAWKLENIQPITEQFAVKGKQGLFTLSLDIFQSQQKLTELLGNNQVNPSNVRDRDLENSPSNDISPSKKRQKGKGNGYIHWRTIIKNGKDYPQAYYHWKENGQKRTKYIPKQLLGVVEEAEKQKRPVIEILELLGIGVSPSKLLGDEKNSPSNNENLLGDKQVNTAESIDNTRFIDSPSNSPSNDVSPFGFAVACGGKPSRSADSPSKRRKGDGSGSIYWRTITRGSKDYPQAYYHYEFWSGGDRLIKSSRYIPKRLLAQVHQLDAEKAPVREILGVLGVMI